MWTRRRFLTSGLAASGLATIPGGVTAASATEQGPHSVVVLMLRGGVDGVWAFDPKTRSEVAPRVEVPYTPDQITEAGGLRFGPHWSELAPHAPHLSVVRGVQVRTANHSTGSQQMVRMKTGVSEHTPGVLDIIGTQRGARPLASVTLGSTSNLEFTPASFGGPTFEKGTTVFDVFDELDPDELALLSRVYAHHLESTGSWKSGATLDRTRAHLQQVQALFDRLPGVAAFQPEEWSSSTSGQAIAEDLQRTLWLLENELTRCVYVKVYLNWDSHYDNTKKQRRSSGDFVPVFSRFLDALRTRTGPRGRLADHTMVVAGSELGRFPILNGVRGKDHFPETTLLFAGAGVRTDGRGIAHGQTGPMMEGQALSMSTGLPDRRGRHLVLDDIGTTLLAMTGFDPERYGYRGHRLRFMEAP
jgi:uncharacterized protein (DUF1501 family)